MKKILLIALLLYGVSLFGQRTLYATFQPNDLGMGLRMDERRGEAGYYASIGYGNYKFENGYIKDHLRLTLGGIVYMEQSFCTLGLNIHSYGEHDFGDIKPAKAVLSPFSLELGVGTKLDGVSVAVSMDLLKWDSSLCLGFSF
jgi:hypothetical protein